MFKLPNLSNFDHSDGNTMYMAIYDSIKSSIAQKDMEPNEKLPSKRKLSRRLGVSVKTVENAYEQLLLEGYIYSREKSGYYVEEITDFRVNTSKIPEYDTRFYETEYKVNLRANRNAIEDFPADTWCKLIRETLAENREKLFKTVPFNGLFALRKAISMYLLQNRGMVVSPDQIVIGAGTEYMYSRLGQVLGRGVTYALPEPCSQRLHELYENNNLNYKMIHASKDGFDLLGLEESDCNVIHISPQHQFPLGKIMPVQEKVELLKWANRKKGRYIIEDDYDSEYVVLGRPIQPLYSIDVNGKVIYMNTFSKSVSPAVRISYMILPEELMDRFLGTMSFYSCTVANLEQYALTKFIEGKHLERYTHRIHRKNKKIRHLLIQHLERLEADGVLKMETDCVNAMVIVRLKTLLVDARIKELLKRNDIITSMMSEYYTSAELKQKYSGEIIINYSGLTEDKIVYLCDTLRIIGKEK